MILFLFDWHKRREVIQFLFHGGGVLPIGNAVNHTRGWTTVGFLVYSFQYALLKAIDLW